MLGNELCDVPMCFTLLQILGLGVLGIGIWLKVDQTVANLGQAVNIGLSDPVIDIVAWLFIGAGIFVFVVGFLGCCSAIKESQILLGFVSALYPTLWLQ